MEKSNDKGRLIAIISAVVLGVSAFLPWASAAGVMIKGTEGDGYIVLGIAIVALLLLLVKKVPVWLPFIAGIIGFVVGVIDAFGVSETAEIGGKVSYGLYLVIFASLGVIIGSLIQITLNRRQ